MLSQYWHTFVSCVSTQQLVYNCTNLHFIVNSAVNMGECTISCLRQFFMKRLKRNAFELISLKSNRFQNATAACDIISFGYTRERHIYPFNFRQIFHFHLTIWHIELNWRLICFKILMNQLLLTLFIYNYELIAWLTA
jgi:hypothetical protein